MRKIFGIELFWLALFLGTRFYTLYFCLGYAWTDEEYYRGSIALEFLDFFRGHGLKLPLWQYQADTYLGGTLLVGWITGLNFLLFGVHLLSLKLTALYFSFATLGLLYFWLKKEVSAAAANAFAFLYVLASPGFISLGLISMGYHTESTFFFAATLVLAHQLQRNFSLGFLTGFAFWFSQINLPASLAAILMRKSKGIFYFGLALGLIPWFYFNWNFHGAGITTLTKDFLLPENVVFFPDHSLLYWKVRKLAVFLLRDLAYFHRFSQLWISYVYFACLLLLLSGFPWRKHRFLSKFLALSAGLFLLTFVASNRMIFLNQEVVSHRYLMILELLILVAASVQARYFSPRVLGALMALGLLAILGLWQQFDFYSPLHRFYPGSLLSLGEKLASDNFSQKELMEFVETSRKFPPEKQAYFLAGLKNFDYSGESRLEQPLVQKALAQLSPREKIFLWRRLGQIYAEKKLPLRSDLPRAFGEGYVQAAVAMDPLAKFSQMDLQEWGSFWRGFWQVANSCKLPKQEGELSFLRGVGAGMRTCEPSLRKAAQDLEQRLGEEKTRIYAWGFGWNLRSKFLEDPLRVKLTIESLPEKYQASAFAGEEAFKEFFGIPPIVVQ